MLSLLILMLFFLTSIELVTIYQKQYYDLRRLVIYLTQALNIKFIIISLLFLTSFFVKLNNLFLIISALILFSNTHLKLKITFRVVRLFSFYLLIGYIVIRLLINYLTIYQLFISLYVLRIAILVTSNTLDFLIRLIINKYYELKCQKKLKKYQPFIILITGSYGKTSFKHFLKEALGSLAFTPKGNINTFKGVVREIVKGLEEYSKYLIIEVGLDRKGGVRKFLKFFKSDYGVLTGIDNMHLLTFRSISNIVNEKEKVLKNSIRCIYNADSNYLGDLPYFSYSYNDAKIKQHNTYNLININDEVYVSNVKGKSQLTNLIGVIKLLRSINVPYKTLFQNLANVTNYQNRFKISQKGKWLYVDDGYNSNPTGFRNALEEFKDYKFKKYLLTPGVIELGKESLKINQSLCLKAIELNYEVYLVKYKNKGFLKALKDNNLKINYFKSLKNALLNIPKEQECLVLIENDVDDYFLR